MPLRTSMNILEITQRLLMEREEQGSYYNVLESTNLHTLMHPMPPPFSDSDRLPSSNDEQNMIIESSSVKSLLYEQEVILFNVFPLKSHQVSSINVQSSATHARSRSCTGSFPSEPYRSANDSKSVSLSKLLKSCTARHVQLLTRLSMTFSYYGEIR